MRALCVLLILATGCSEEQQAEIDPDLPPCEAETRDYDLVEGRVPWAGQQRFYRLDGEQFCETTNKVLSEVPPGEALEGVKVLVSPHAGWQFSGLVTATMLSRIDVPDLVIIIGNNHKDKGEKYAVYPDGAWSFPVGDIPVDEQLAASLIAEVDDFVADKEAHSNEHSVELQVVWLSRFNPDIRIVPIAVDNTDDLGKLETVGAQIAATLEGVDEPYLVIVSTDLTHFLPEDVGQRRDSELIDKIVAMEPQPLFDLVAPARSDYNMCGLEPTVIGMVIARALGAAGGELVMRRTSFEVNSDADKIVGYAGVVYR